MKSTDKKAPLNAVWKIIFKEFRDFVCQTAEAKLEKLIGKNNFFLEQHCDLKQADSVVTDMPTNPKELFSSKATSKQLMLGQGYAFLNLMGIPQHLHSDRTAHQIYLLLCHKKVSRSDNKILSEFSALFRGNICKIKMSYYSIFSSSHKKARKCFFEEQVIQVFWSRFCTEKKAVFVALQRLCDQRLEFLKTIKFPDEVTELRRLLGF